MKHLVYIFGLIVGQVAGALELGDGLNTQPHICQPITVQAGGQVSAM